MIVFLVMSFTGIVNWILTGSMQSGSIAVISLGGSFIITAIIMKGLAYVPDDSEKRKNHVSRPKHFD